MLILPRCLDTISSRVVASVAGFALLVGCGGGGSSQGARTWTFGLGDLAAEQAYYESSDGGAIHRYADKTAPDVFIKYMKSGDKFLAVNPTLLGAFSPKVQFFFTLHEYGHFYRGDPGIVTGVPDLTEEWLADAYATRVFFAEYDAYTVQQCAIELAALALPGDATHPSSTARAAYMQDVLYALIANERNVPAPPGVSNLLPPTGWLVASDTTGLVTDVFVDSIPVGGPIPDGSIVLEMMPGAYRIDLYDDITGFRYWTGIATITNGKTTYTPF
jgi:hypothetical protein